MGYKKKFKLKLHPSLVVFGWIAALLLITATVYVPLYEDQWAGQAQAAWRTLRRPIFGLGVCWVILACSTGFGGIINSILSWEGWLPWSRLSYVGYLIHPISLYWYTHNQPFQIYYSIWTIIFWFMAQLVFSLGWSLVISVFYEAPFLALEKLMFADLHKPKHSHSVDISIPLSEKDGMRSGKVENSEPNGKYNSMQM